MDTKRVENRLTEARMMKLREYYNKFHSNELELQDLLEQVNVPVKTRRVKSKDEEMAQIMKVIQPIFDHKSGQSVENWAGFRLWNSHPDQFVLKLKTYDFS